MFFNVLTVCSRGTGEAKDDAEDTGEEQEVETTSGTLRWGTWHH